MRRRDRLTLWLLRRLAPHGLGAGGIPLTMGFDSGLSTADDLQLVMRIRSISAQPIVSVIVDPEHLIETSREFLDAKTHAEGGA